MTTAEDSVDVRRYAREYERLRSQVNGVSAEHPLAPPPVRGIGLALLLRDGLPAWIQAVRQVLSEAAASATRSAGAVSSQSARAPAAISPAAAGMDGSDVLTASSALLQTARQRDLTTLLASLVLSVRRTAEAASMKEPSPCH
jgi:hypothetical protein